MKNLRKWSLSTTTPRIAYVVGLNNFKAWTIYYFALLSASGEVKETGTTEGYGIDELKKYITDRTLLFLGGHNVSINFIMKYNNQDTSGWSDFDVNLNNADYMRQMLKEGGYKKVKLYGKNSILK